MMIPPVNFSLTSEKYFWKHSYKMHRRISSKNYLRVSNFISYIYITYNLKSKVYNFQRKINFLWKVIFVKSSSIKYYLILFIVKNIWKVNHHVDSSSHLRNSGMQNSYVFIYWYHSKNIQKTVKALTHCCVHNHGRQPVIKIMTN